MRMIEPAEMLAYLPKIKFRPYTEADQGWGGWNTVLGRPVSALIGEAPDLVGAGVGPPVVIIEGDKLTILSDEFNRMGIQGFRLINDGSACFGGY